MMAVLVLLVLVLLAILDGRHEKREAAEAALYDPEDCLKDTEAREQLAIRLVRRAIIELPITFIIVSCDVGLTKQTNRAV